MADTTPATYRIEAVRAVHERTVFDCGHPFLNTYLVQFARQNDRNGYAKAYVMVPAKTGNPVVGYYTLSSSQVAFDAIPPTIRKRLPRYPAPAVRIGELAVDVSHKGKGLGSQLILDALERIIRASDEVAVWAVIVDPIDQQATTFYQHHGFEPLLDSDAMFLTLKDAVAWLTGG